jgi:Domain of unknown function (DUF5753)/Helix-turn-helix domain
MLMTTEQSDAGPAVARRLLGWCLRDLRQQARLTLRVAAAALEWSEPKMWRIETGQAKVRGLDVEAMCALYGAPPGLTGALVSLAKTPGTGRWWHTAAGAVAGGFDVAARLEEHAGALEQYEPRHIPALLRTGAYARALITVACPGASAEEVSGLVGECLARQVLVTRAGAPLRLTVILSEPVLRCPAGSPQVMAGQLRRLAELAMLPHVSLRVVPFAAGLHPGLRAGAFTLLHFPPPSGGEPGPVTVHLPGYTGDLYLDTPGDVRCYQDAYAAISGCALDEAATRDLVLRAAKELEQ